VATGIVLGLLGLIEPVARFWGKFHLLGKSWIELYLLCLGPGLAASCATGFLVALGLSAVRRRHRPIVVASYVLTGSPLLLLAIAALSLLRRSGLTLPVATPTPVLLALLLLGAVLLTVVAAPRLTRPLLDFLFGRRRSPGSRPRRPSSLLPLSLPLVLLAVVGAAAAPNRPRSGSTVPPTRSAAGGRELRNVLLITIDALRADHLGTYGYARATSPVMDSLAAVSVVFEQCFAQGNRTELSMGSLFTSLYPSLHGVRALGEHAQPLPGGIRTLSEMLREGGLETVGLMSNPNLKREWGLIRGFDRVEEYRYGYTELSSYRALARLGIVNAPDCIAGLPVPRSSAVSDDAIREMRRLRDRPFFLFVHFMDVHHPYIPPPEFQRIFQTPQVSFEQPEALWARTWSVFNRLPSSANPLPPEDLTRIVDLYDGAIRSVDTEIGRLLMELRRLGLDEETMVILSSDHGDEFLEHGDIFHKTPYLYDELTHVPLIVHWPQGGGGRTGRVSEIVRHIDLMPTLSEIFGLTAGASVQGTSLRPLLTDSGGWTPKLAFSQSYRCSGVRTPTLRAMYELERGEFRCFDLQRDPSQSTETEDPALRASMAELLKQFVRETRGGERDGQEMTVDRRTQELLRSIGYVN
jgi:arylsulfatase